MNVDPRRGCGCCCVEWHRTLRVAIVSIVTLVHGLMLVGYGVLP